MQKRRNSNYSRSIIAPTRVISLYESDWKCLASEAWSPEHHEFFNKKAEFFSFTIGRDMRPGGNIPGHHVGDWIVESSPGVYAGYMRLQMLNGDFKKGYLLMSLPVNAFNSSAQTLVTQFFTSLLILQKLDTLMIVPVDELSARTISECASIPVKSIMTFSKGATLSPKALHPFVIERDHWLSSDQGKTALEHLGWLKRRVERETKIANPEVKPRKLSWLSGLLSLGFRRSRSVETPHPLDTFRRRNS